MKGRIWFEGNPWPNGHAIKTAEFFITLSEAGEGAWPPEAGAYLGLKIESQYYYAEMSDEEQKQAYEADAKSIDQDIATDDWESFIVWQNYHACTLSASNAQIGTRSHPFELGAAQTKLIFEQGKKAVSYNQDRESSAFIGYILGHDSLADHELLITETPGCPGFFDIKWSGAVALTYVGAEEFSYRFRAEMTRVPFLGIEGPRYQESRERKSLFGLLRKHEWYDLRQDRSVPSREADLRELAMSCLKFKQDDYVFHEKDRMDWLVPKVRLDV